MAGDAAPMEGRTPSVFLRRVAPSDGELTMLWQDCFSGVGGRESAQSACKCACWRWANQTAAFSKANFLSDREVAGRGKWKLRLVLPELIVLTK